jgi:hypothetical protein
MILKSYQRSIQLQRWGWMNTCGSSQAMITPVFKQFTKRIERDSSSKFNGCIGRVKSTEHLILLQSIRTLVPRTQQFWWEKVTKKLSERFQQSLCVTTNHKPTCSSRKLMKTWKIFKSSWKHSAS